MHRSPVSLIPLLAGLLLGLTPAAVPAQYFGKNKVQYDSFEWSVIETDNFHVYFYSEEEQAAKDAARMAERAYAKLSRILGHEVKAPIPLIVYASHTDFQQTNALAGLIGEGTGGVTEFFKRRVVLPFTGAYGEFDHVLTHELVHAFQIDILFGSERSAVTSRLGNTPPLWFMEGMAEYLSIGSVDEHTQMWLRDAALEGYLISIDELALTGDIRVYRFGQSIMAFIADRYGVQKIGEMLKNVAKRANLARAVQASLGISLADLSKQWTEEVRKTHLPQIAEFQKPEEYGYRLTNHDKDLSRLNLAPAVSPDGDRMAFLSDRSLYNDIYLASAIDGKVLDKLVEGERNADFESLRFLMASMSWSPDQTMLAFAAKKGGEDAIYLLEVDGGKVRNRLTFGFDGIQSPSFSPDGTQLVFVGLQGGRSDLFITDIDGKNLKRLTHDRYADRDPHWSPDGTRIAFTTDRGPGTNFKTLDFDPFRIAIYDLATDQVRVLPNQHGKNISPQWSPDGDKIAFVSDRTGISNVYVIDLASGESFQLTNILTGISGIMESSPPLSWSSDGDRMLFSVFNRGGWDIFAVKNPLDLLDREPSPAPRELAGVGDVGPGPGWQVGGESAPRPIGGSAPAVYSEPLQPGGEPADEQRDTGAEPGGDRIEDDALAAEAETDEEATAEETAAAAVSDGDGEATLATAPGSRQPDVTGSPAGPDTAPDDQEAEEEEPVDLSYRPPAPDGTSFRIRDYDIQFSPDVLVGGGGFAPGLGVAGQFALGLSDVLGNHHIQLAANLFGNLSDSDVFLTYLNLQRRTNWGITLFQFRNDFLSFQDNAVLRFDREIYRGGEFFVSRPFSKFRRFETSMQFVSVDRGDLTAAEGEQIQSPLGVPFEGQVFFVRPQLALVTDNVLFGSTGPISGARARLSVAQAFGDLEFTTALLDARKYFNLRQRYVFALRALGVSSFGGTPQRFRVGGPYTIRGYGFESLRGNNVGVVNAEFRFPLIEQLRFGWPLPLALRGIRGVLFFDAGTAFDGTQFQAFDGTGGGLVRLQDIVASYGFGARLNLGFLILRWDIAQKTDLSSNHGAGFSTISIGADY